MQRMRSFFVLVAVLLAASITTHTDRQGASRSVPAERPSATPATDGRPHGLVSGYGKLPLSFEPITDKQDADRRPLSFLASGRGYALELSGHEAVVALSGGAETAGVGPARSPDLTAAVPKADARLTVQFVGGRTDATGRGEAPLPGKVHRLIGNQPAAWRTNIPTYAAVRYEGVYPGIDLVYYGREGDLEYDFVVAPGADPTAIALSFEGADAVQVDNAGDLLLATTAGMVRQHKPFLYQEAHGQRQTVDGRYVLDGAHVRVEVGAYDTSRSLVIDPVLVFSGGVGGQAGTGVAVDAAGNAYVGGFTVPDPLRDAFVTKIDASGTAVLWTAFIGGAENDVALAIALDDAGSAYVTGSTRSTDFPTLNAFDSTYGGPVGYDSYGEAGYGDAFVAKFAPDGAALVYSTYLGTAGDERGTGIAVRNGHAYVIGEAGAGFPTTPGAFQAVKPGTHFKAFVTQLSATGSTLVYSTYLGAPDDGTPASGGYPDYGRAIALDAAGNAYLTGVTQSNNFPTRNPAQTWSTPTSYTADGRDWAFVTKLNPTGSALVYSTYLGGGLSIDGPLDGYNWTQGAGIAVDGGGHAYVTGQTSAVNFPLTAGAFDRTCARPAGSHQGCGEAFVTKLSANGGAFVYSSYLGGTNTAGSLEIGNGIAVDAAGRAYVVGSTSTSDFPVVNPFQTGVQDAFLSVVNPAGSALEFSTYLGGTDAGEDGFAIALDSSLNAYVVGRTISSNFPRVGGLPNPGGGDVSSAGGFIAKFSAVDCNYAVAPMANVSAPAAGVTGDLSLATASGCGWSARSSVPWLTVTPGGTGPATVTYTVAPNTSASPRTGTFTVAGTTIVVQQAGFVPPPCTFTVAPTSDISVPAAGIAGTINVTTGSACPWATSATGSWLSVTPASRTGSGAATYTAAPNASTIPRNGTITVAGTTIAVQQAGVAPGPPTGPPSAPVNVSATVSGNTINLTWATPTSGAAPTDYTLVGRITAGGAVVATVPMGPGTAFSVAAPNGTFALSVRASNASGTGPESATVIVTVPQAAPLPGPPSGLTTSTTGSTVSFSWTPPSSGGPVASYALVAGLTPAFSVPLTTLPVGPTPGFVVPGVPPGTYYVRVLAQNASGASAASNEVTVTVGGANSLGAPTLQPPTVTGSTVALSWSAGAGDTPTHYTLMASVTPNGAPIQTVPLTGTAVSFSSVPSGTYYLRLTATNGAGTSPPSAPVTVAVP